MKLVKLYPCSVFLPLHLLHGGKWWKSKIML